MLQRNTQQRGAIRRALRHRDRCCRFPGCTRSRWLDGHHVVHWADGGVRFPRDVALALAGGAASVNPCSIPSGSLTSHSMRSIRSSSRRCSSLRAIPGWWTLVPAIAAIVLALALRQVVPALLSGVWIGAWIGYGGPLTGILRTIDTYVVDALSDPDHVAILVFSLLLGGMVGIISRSGENQKPL